MVASGPKATGGGLLQIADSPTSEYGNGLAQGFHHRRVKFACQNVFAEFSHGGSVVPGVAIGASK